MWCELYRSGKYLALLSDYVLAISCSQKSIQFLQNAIWADLKTSDMGRGPGKALWIMPKIKYPSIMEFGPSSLDC
jgi:hypothetical protein